MMVPTPSGDARVDLDRPAGEPRGLLVLGHGAGGGVEAPDLVAVAAAAVQAGLAVARVTQPYRVAGRRSPPRAPVLDAAWLAVVAHLRTQSAGPAGAAVPADVGSAGSAGVASRAGPRPRSASRAAPRVGGRGGMDSAERLLGDLPLVVGGRSSGARVACRTATEVGAAAVVALAFPTRAPGRPDRDRLDELAMPTVPVLVVQGDRDPFGVPPPARGRTVHLIAGGTHALRGPAAGAAAAAVVGWLIPLVGTGTRSRG